MRLFPYWMTNKLFNKFLKQTFYYQWRWTNFYSRCQTRKACIKASSQRNRHSKYDSGIEELLLKVVSFHESEFQRFEVQKTLRLFQPTREVHDIWYQDMHYIDAERSAGIPEEMKYNHVDEYASEPGAENKRIQNSEQLKLRLPTSSSVKEKKTSIK